MPTSHLFRESDLEFLENNPLSGKFKILVVGTFNGNIEGNEATWFYGRAENEFWCLFPRMMDLPTLHAVDRDENINELTFIWKQFCKDNGVVIVDLFKEVLVDLPDHADRYLKALNPDEYVPFDFETAFANCTFDLVLFTWKGVKPNTLTDMKSLYTLFFGNKGSTIGHLLTPSNAYSKPRKFKLTQWKEVYGE